MNLDRSFIAIRHRTILEIMDLALHVTRTYFAPLMVLLLIGSAPFIVLNWICLRWLHDAQYAWYFDFYGWLMALLVINQAPAATIMVSHYLGQVMFIQRPSIWGTVRSVTARFWPLLVVHGFLGMIIPVGALCWLMGDNELFGLLFFFAIVLFFLGLGIRLFRPYVSEILTLERTPWQSLADARSLNFSRRSSMLHGHAAGDHFAAALARGSFGWLIALALFVTLHWFSEKLGTGLHVPEWSVVVLWPMALWMTMGFLAVVRFLSYINARILQEGWDVELKVRAEAQKLMAKSA